MSLLLDILLSSSKLFQGWVCNYGLTFLKALIQALFFVRFCQPFIAVRFGNKKECSTFAENVYKMCLKPVGWSFVEYFLPMVMIVC